MMIYRGATIHRQAKASLFAENVDGFEVLPFGRTQSTYETSFAK